MTSAGLPSDIASQIRRQETTLLEKGQRLGRFDKIREREFYSCYLFAPGLNNTIQAGKYPVFSSIEGDTGQGYLSALTKRETNWLNKKRIPDQQNILIKSFHVEIRRPPQDFSATGLSIYSPSVLSGGALANPPANGTVDPRVPIHPADVSAIAYGATLNLVYLTDSIPQGLLADFPAVGGAGGFVEASRQYPNNATVGETNTPTGVGNRAFLPLTRNSTAVAFERRPQVPALFQHGENFSMEIVVPNPIQLQGIGPAIGANGENNSCSGVVEVKVSFWAVESYVERS